MRRVFAKRTVMLAAAILLAAPPAPAQTPASDYEGATALGLALRRLGVTKRVLMIGAHPDDESTQILSTLALGQGAEVAYLSLSRGEGGQNGIGPELEEGLGLLRTEELLAARRLDGARQYFTRAYDFGYSKNAEEAFRHWPRDSLLSDVVGVVRKFRPDMVISIFSGTPRDGHGQHQVAGILAREAFEAAGDPARFPEQLAAGLRPHTPVHLYQSYYRPNEQAELRLPTGELDPLLGRSNFQVAMASRSRHRSQDMGRPLTPGPQWSNFDRIATHAPQSGASGEMAPSLFAGVDTSLAARARALPGVPEDVINTLRIYDRDMDRVRAEANLLAPGALVSGLAGALRTLRQAERSLADRENTAELQFLLAEEQDDARAALARAAGIVLDATADDERVTPGQQFELQVTLWNGGERPVTVRALVPELPDGWRAEPLDSLPPEIAPGVLHTRRFRVQVPANAPPSEPYHLREPRSGDLYRWPDETVLAGQPFEPAPVHAAATVEVDGVALPLVREATFRAVDKMQGEFRRPVQVVPRTSVQLEPEIALVPLSSTEDRAQKAGAGGRRTSGQGSRGREPLRFMVRVTAEDLQGISGTLRLVLPNGWRSEPESVPLRFGTPGEERSVEFAVTPVGVTAGEHTVAAVFEAEGGERFTRGYQLVDYPHTRPRPLYRPATATVQSFEVNLPPQLRVGYIVGAGDEIPEALRQLGITPDLLDEAALARGNLNAYDVILTGIRAYEVRPDLAAHNARLLDYVRQGGTMIVQYNKYEYPEGGFAPYPVTMAQPHDRVTDEAAPVRLLDPSHPVLSRPNRITAADFEGWRQERGLYFLNTWDDRYTPLLEMSDPGEESLRGGLVVAPYGRGTYAYTGISFFRQLPAGVPGAYRLFANLLALGAK
jgi:LmbE family N-acetylglucosaminyl deacetylase